MECYIKEVESTDSVELYVNKEFEASWSLAAYTKSKNSILNQMLAVAWECGKIQARKDIKKVLGL